MGVQAHPASANSAGFTFQRLGDHLCEAPPRCSAALPLSHRRDRGKCAMPSYSLLQRGLIYFSIKGSTFLPLLKHSMDYYYSAASSPGCGRPIFPLVCTDDWGSTWSLSTEVGAESVAAVVAAITICLHTAVAIAFLVMAACSPPKQGFMYLVALEDGCCGAAAVFMSLGAFDVEVEIQRKGNTRWRRVVHTVTAGLQLVIVVCLAAAINTVSGSDASYPERTSIFVLLPALMLNIYSLFENVFEGTKGVFE
ncbi:hypothetical protein HK405_010997 [Cladochytrium tenue]|nr:hypothetical protein HK405_010997 [Cladochytrium tenue]